MKQRLKQAPIPVGCPLCGSALTRVSGLRRCVSCGHTLQPHFEDRPYVSMNSGMGALRILPAFEHEPEPDFTGRKCEDARSLPLDFLSD